MLEQNQFTRFEGALDSGFCSLGITFDPENENTPFIKEFLMRGIYRTLLDFDCGEYESSRFIQWFVEKSRFWPIQESQAAFNAYARERLSDRVGYTRRKLDAFHVIDQYFDKGYDLTFDDVIAAVHFCAPQEAIPHEVFYNEGSVIIDLPRQPRQKKDRLLKVDEPFWPTLELIYPWERVEDSIIKLVPVGTGVREFDVLQLAFWFRYRNAGKDERENAVSFHSADPLDWTAKNLYSRWREGFLAERYSRRIDPLPADGGVIPTIDARFGMTVDGKQIPPSAPNNVTSILPTVPSKTVSLDDDLLKKLGA